MKEVLRGLGRTDFKRLVFLAVFYTCLSFAYSLLAFLYPHFPGYNTEYASQRLAIEILGHFAFGVLASIPLLDLQLSLLTGGLAVLIDVDHILAVIGYSVSGRPDHNFLYLLVSAVLLFIVAKRLGYSSGRLAKVAFVGPIALFSHISYDLYAAGPPYSAFPLFAPFSFQNIYLPYSDWLPFEIAGLAVAVMALFLARRLQRKAMRKAQATSQAEQLKPKSTGTA